MKESGGTNSEGKKRAGTTFSEAVAMRASSAQFIVRGRAPEPEPTRDPHELRMSDPVFAKLALPELPPLPDSNRAWLQIQSPRRLFFYWSLKSDFGGLLSGAFGDAAARYGLVIKLVNETRGAEEMHPAPSEGDWWFDVEPDCTYRAEVGFRAEGRPYVRAVFSNTVTTPRRGPSTRSSDESEWAVSSELFSRVLLDSGFEADAIEVALHGDDESLALERTRAAVESLIGAPFSIGDLDPEELRHAMLLLASGLSLEEIRDRVGESVYRFLLRHLADLSPERALAALSEHFELIEGEYSEERTVGPHVFGASRIHSPRVLRFSRKTLVPIGRTGGHRPTSSSKV